MATGVGQSIAGIRREASILKFQRRFLESSPAGIQITLCEAKILIHFPSMNENTQKNRIALQPFQTGQVWQMEHSNLQIRLVGKTLVHYKHYKRQVKGSPVSLLNKDALEKFLRDNRAVLAPE